MADIIKATRRRVISYGLRMEAGEEIRPAPDSVDFTVEINVDKLLAQIGRRAWLSKGKASRVACGAVVIRARPANRFKGGTDGR